MTPEMDIEGEYRYLLNGESAPVEEHWRIKSLDGDQRLMTSERIAPGIRIKVNATEQAGIVSQCQIAWQSEQSDELTVEYFLAAESFRYRLGDDDWRSVSPDTGDSLVLYPLMRIFTGPVILRLAALGGEGDVLVPAIGDPSDRDGLLRPELTRRCVTHLASEADGDLWQFTGGQYDESARFWIDSSGLLARYLWRQDADREWDVRLQM